MNYYLEKQKPEPLTRDEDNFLIGSDGCCYQSERAVLHFARLHLCGCGCPEDAYNFCREVLSAFDRRPSRLPGNDPDHKPWANAETEVETLIKAKPDVAAHVLSHLLNHFGLLEHGGSVGGSWCTDVGHQIIDLGPASEDDFDWEKAR